LKLHAETMAMRNTFTAYGDGYVEVNRKQYGHSIIVLPDAPIIDWPVSSFATLGATHFEQLCAALATQPVAVLLFGSGIRTRFVSPAVTACLIEKQIGIETMDTHAACRTYNILLAEGRKVGAALLIEPPC
jgi:uncharacterized protein